MAGGDFGCSNVDCNPRGLDADIDQDGSGAGRFDQRFDVVQLLAFGVSRADDVNPLHGIKRWMEDEGGSHAAVCASAADFMADFIASPPQKSGLVALVHRSAKKSRPGECFLL